MKALAAWERVVSKDKPGKGRKTWNRESVRCALNFYLPHHFVFPWLLTLVNVRVERGEREAQREF